MTQRTTLLAGAVLAALAIALGAFGAHALRPILLANSRVDAYEIAVRYQIYHAFALLFAGLMMNTLQNTKLIQFAATCWVVGTFLFSGSLYAISFVSIPGVGILTPVGGIFFLAGWGFLLWGIGKNK